MSAGFPILLVDEAARACFGLRRSRIIHDGNWLGINLDAPAALLGPCRVQPEENPMKVSQMNTSEVLVLLAIVLSVTGLGLFAIEPAGKSPALGLVVIGVAAVFAIGAGAWAISEQD
jgi:hypothetical protein